MLHGGGYSVSPFPSQYTQGRSTRVAPYVVLPTKHFGGGDPAIPSPKGVILEKAMLASIGARLQIKSEPGSGTTIAVKAPMQALQGKG
jgi:hypothetical protein